MAASAASTKPEPGEYVTKEATYDARSEKLSIEIPDADRYGMVDGATTDRTLARLKKHLIENIQTTEPNVQSFEQLKLDELPPYMKDAVVRVEIIAGNVDDLIVPLAGARNTSKQVEEFTLQNLDGAFTWIKEAIEKTEFKDKIRFREAELDAPFEVRKLLSLLTLFHPRWTTEGEEPTVAYTAKGQVLNQYLTPEWRAGYVALKDVLPDILRLYDWIGARFTDNYQGSGRGNIKNRKVIKHYKRGFHHLKLTGAKIEYHVPDALIYPILAAFRALLEFPNGGPARWQVSPVKIDPFKFWDEVGRTMVDDVMSTAKTLKDNPLQVGKFKGLWKNLHKTVEMRKLRLNQGEKLQPAPPPIIHDPEVRLKLAKQK